MKCQIRQREGDCRVSFAGIAATEGRARGSGQVPRGSGLGAVQQWMASPFLGPGLATSRAAQVLLQLHAVRADGGGKQTGGKFRTFRGCPRNRKNIM